MNLTGILFFYSFISIMVNSFSCALFISGQKLFIHPRSDAPSGTGPFGYGGTAVRSNDLPSSSYNGQSYSQQSGAPGTFHASHAVYLPDGSSSSGYAPYSTQQPPSYPRRPEDNFIPGFHVDDRRVALKRRNPITHPVDSVSAGRLLSWQFFQ